MTLLLSAACAITQLAFYLLLSWLPLVLVAKGIAPSFAPWAIFAFSTGNLLGAPAMGVAIDRLGQRGPTAGGYVALAVVVSGFALAAHLGSLPVIAFMAGFLVNGVQIALYGVSSRYYPQAVRGRGVGAVIGIGRAGSIVGPLAAGSLLAHGFDSNAVMLILALILPLGTLSVLFLPRPEEMSWAKQGVSG